MARLMLHRKLTSRIFVASVLAAITFPALIFVAYRLTTSTSEPSSDLRVDEFIHLGNVQRGKTVTASFDLNNKGNRPIKVSGFRSSCSCTKIYQKEKNSMNRVVNEMTLAPGERQTISTDIEVGGEVGVRQTSMVFFSSHEPGHFDYSVPIHYTAVTRLYLLPRELTFGQVPLSREVTFDTELRGDGDFKEPVSSLEINSIDGVQLKAELVEDTAFTKFRDPTQTSIGHLRFRLKCDEPLKKFRSVFKLVINGKDSVDLPVSFSIIEPFSFVPGLLVLPKQGSSGPVYEAEVRCQSAEGEDFDLVATKIPDALDVRISTPSKGVSILLIKLKQVPPIASSVLYKLEFACEREGKSVPVAFSVMVGSREATKPTVSSPTGKER